MAGIDLDLSGFAAARRDLAALALRQRAADADLAGAKAALDAAIRAGASANDTPPLAARVAAAQAARAALVASRRNGQEQFDRLADRVLRQRDPALSVGALDGHQPIALLPMRLETRYVAVPGQATQLRIRVYPDDINTINHEPAPTANEALAGMAYWSAVFAHADDEAERLLRDLTAASGRGRASWLVRVLTPTNPIPAADAQAAPAFPPDRKSVV